MCVNSIYNAAIGSLKSNDAIYVSALDNNNSRTHKNFTYLQFVGKTNSQKKRGQR